MVFEVHVIACVKISFPFKEEITSMTVYNASFIHSAIPGLRGHQLLALLWMGRTFQIHLGIVMSPNSRLRMPRFQVKALTHPSAFAAQGPQGRREVWFLFFRRRSWSPEQLGSLAKQAVELAPPFHHMFWPVSTHCSLQCNFFRTGSPKKKSKKTLTLKFLD